MHRHTNENSGAGNGASRATGVGKVFKPTSHRDELQQATEALRTRVGIERRRCKAHGVEAQPQGLAPLMSWMDHYAVFWRDRFANLRTLLKEIDP